MPLNAKVFIHYGPYLAAYTVEHRLSRLQGLQSKCEEKIFFILR